jgi:MarR-like DNA-binding transcriptional regulator SgrR of sgrS sRNA
LWLRGARGTDDRRGGPGPFRSTDEADLLVASPPDANGRPLLEAIELLEPGESDPALLFEVDAVDLAVVSGRDAAPLVDGPDTALRVERLTRWDTVYALWFGARARWVNDPRFRAWVADAVDRDAMLRYLFDGRGESAFRLTPGGGPEWSEPPKRPFSRGSTPSLELIFDSADPDAVSIASRLQAVLEPQGLAIRLEPTNGDRLRERTEDKGFQVALVAHRPPVIDPVLALQHTLWALGNPEPEAWASLRRASWWEEEERRRAAALFVEDTLLQQARLVPLVRVHAWLVTRPELEGLSAGAWGVLRFERARWVR